MPDVPKIQLTGIKKSFGEKHVLRGLDLSVNKAESVVVIGLVTGHGVILGLQHTDMVLLLLTLGVSVVTFASGRANVMQGAVHLLLFSAYLMLLFER